MSRGQADYGLTTTTPVASGISDPGEAAARLGSINVYDRRGWTVWMDDFESPSLKWAATCSFGGTSPVLSTTMAWMGAQSLYFVTAAVGASWAQAIRYFPLVRRGRVGIEFWIFLSTFTPNYMRVNLRTDDGVQRSEAELQLDFEAKTVTIVTDIGNVVVATNCFNAAGYNVFTPIKLVVDMDTDRYVRLLIGPDEIDLSAYALWIPAASLNRFIRVIMNLTGGVAGVGSAYVDNFILTQNEP